MTSRGRAPVLTRDAREGKQSTNRLLKQSRGFCKLVIAVGLKVVITISLNSRKKAWQRCYSPQKACWGGQGPAES